MIKTVTGAAEKRVRGYNELCTNQTIQKGAAVLAAPFVNSRKESSTISISNINGMILNIFQVDKLLV